MTYREIIRDRSFIDQFLDLTNCHVSGCHFSGCVLELRKEASWMVDNKFENCKLVGNGWPVIG